MIHHCLALRGIVSHQVRNGSSQLESLACPPRIATLQCRCPCRSRASRCALRPFLLYSGSLSRPPFADQLDKLPSPFRSRFAIYPPLALNPAFYFDLTSQISPRLAGSIRATFCSTTACFGIRRFPRSCADETRPDRRRSHARVHLTRTPTRTRPAFHSARASDTV